MNKIILTGATGFIGHFLLAELIKDNFEVHCFINTRQPKIKDKNIFLHKIDLLSVNEEELQALMNSINANTLYHCAWYTNHKDYLFSKINLSWLEASKRLANVFYRTGGERFIGLGSCIEYDFEKINPTIPEIKTDHPIKSKWLYGQCKIELFNYLDNLNLSDNKKYIWARVFFVYGPRDRGGRLIPYIFNQLTKNQEAIPRFGGILRDYIFVTDLAKQLSFLSKSTTSGVINTGRGIGERIGSIFQEVGKCMNKADLILDNQNTCEDKLTEPNSIVGEVSPELKMKFTELSDGIKSTLDFMTSEASERNFVK